MTHMAKITYSGLVDEIKGSLGGSTIKGHKAGSILKQKTTPRRPRTQSQQRLRGYVNQLSGDWYSLPDTNKELWNKYASLLSGKLSGFNAFIMLNTRLLKTGHASLVQIISPPSSPGTPPFVNGLTFAITDTTHHTISWSAPLDSSNYVSVFYAIQAGYSPKNKESWHFIATVRSDTGQIIHTHSYPLGTIFFYRALSIDLFGRIAPWSTASGLCPFGYYYGQSYYGDGYYGSCFK